jgi:hypothetical protein
MKKAHGGQAKSSEKRSISIATERQILNILNLNSMKKYL